MLRDMCDIFLYIYNLDAVSLQSQYSVWFHPFSLSIDSGNSTLLIFTFAMRGYNFPCKFYGRISFSSCVFFCLPRCKFEWGHEPAPHSLQWAYQFELLSRFAFILTLFDAALTFNSLLIFFFLRLLLSCCVAVGGGFVIFTPAIFYIYLCFICWLLHCFRCSAFLFLAFWSQTSIFSNWKEKQRQRARFFNTAQWMSSSWFKRPVND